MKKVSMIGIMAVFSLMLIGAASAAPTGANITGNANETWTPPAADTFNAFGGNTTEMNLSAYQVTGSWVGFWGELTGGLTLRDAAGNSFYDWTVTDMTDAYVYAANGSVDWSTIVKEDGSYLPDHINDGGTDDFNVTFSSQEAFQSASLGPIASTNYTTTLGGSSFKTYGLRDTTNTRQIYAGKAQNDQTSFNAATTDYQLLAPAPSSGGVTYTFYLEMP